MPKCFYTYSLRYREREIQYNAFITMFVFLWVKTHSKQHMKLPQKSIWEVMLTSSCCHNLLSHCWPEPASLGSEKKMRCRPTRSHMNRPLARCNTERPSDSLIPSRSDERRKALCDRPFQNASVEKKNPKRQTWVKEQGHILTLTKPIANAHP